MHLSACISAVHKFCCIWYFTIPAILYLVILTAQLLSPSLQRIYTLDASFCLIFTLHILNYFILFLLYVCYTRYSPRTFASCSLLIFKNKFCIPPLVANYHIYLCPFFNLFYIARVYYLCVIFHDYRSHVMYAETFYTYWVKAACLFFPHLCPFILPIYVLFHIALWPVSLCPITSILLSVVLTISPGRPVEALALVSFSTAVTCLPVCRVLTSWVECPTIPAFSIIPPLISLTLVSHFCPS